MPALVNPYRFGGGGALATQATATGLVKLTQGGASSAGITVGSAITSFAKTGNEILSGYPFYYSSDNGASFSSVTTDLGSTVLEGYMGTDGTNWAMAGRLASAPTTYRVWRSANRENWTGATLSGAGTIFGFAYGDSKWVVIAGNSGSPKNIVWYSSDLITWTNPTLSFSVGSPVAYGNGYFLAAATGAVSRAASGSLGTWESKSLAAGWTSNSGMLAYSAVHSRWVIIGTSGGMYEAQYSDDDGSTWTVATVPSPTFTMSAINNVVALSGGGFVAVGITAGSLGAAIYSADGTEWDNIPNADDFQGLYGLVAL